MPPSLPPPPPPQPTYELSVGGVFAAAAKRGATKYGSGANKLLSTTRRSLSVDEAEQLRELTSHSLSRKTWSNYATAERMLATCCREKGIKLRLPVAEDTIIKFLLWMITVRGAKAATLHNYLAGIRQLHIAKGCPPPEIRTGLVAQILKGKANKEAASKNLGEATGRLPVTPDILLLLKARLSESDFCPKDQRMLWTVCTNLFFGAFRGCELLARSETEFDPAYTLLAEDVLIIDDSIVSGEQTVRYRIKAPKEDKLGRITIVDVFQSRSDLCPVRAFQKWKNTNPPTAPGQSAFRWAKGTPLTGGKLTEVIRERLSGLLGGTERHYSTHSFRTGAASMLGALGYSDSDVKALGRWNSRSFERYMKLPRSKRAAVAKEFSKAVV